jgi:hypothetical protein
MDLRIFLTYGMVGSGIFVTLFGMGRGWEQHSMAGGCVPVESSLTHSLKPPGGNP